MKNTKKNIAFQRGLLSLAASIWMTVLAIAFIGLTIMFTTYGPPTLKMWIQARAEVLCTDQGGTLHSSFPTGCGGAGQPLCCS